MPPGDDARIPVLIAKGGGGGGGAGGGAGGAGAGGAALVEPERVVPVLAVLVALERVWAQLEAAPVMAATARRLRPPAPRRPRRIQARCWHRLKLIWRGDTSQMRSVEPMSCWPRV
jgi:hypothetical protein